METPEWLREFSSRHAARIESADRNLANRGPTPAPADLVIVAERIAAFRFDDFVTITFRAVPDESPMPEAFPIAETWCRDDSGNFILCDYQASAGGNTAKILYLSHDPFAFVIVAESMREFLGDISAESGKSYQPLSRRYRGLIDKAMKRFDPNVNWGPQSFAKTGDGMPLFVSVEVSRIEGAGLTLNVPR